MKARTSADYESSCDAVMVELLDKCERAKIDLGVQLKVCISLYIYFHV